MSMIVFKTAVMRRLLFPQSQTNPRDRSIPACVSILDELGKWAAEAIIYIQAGLVKGIGERGGV
jgi:hypothetical protein